MMVPSSRLGSKEFLIQAIDNIQDNSGFTESQIVTAQKRKLCKTAGLLKLFKLKLEAKGMLMSNFDMIY